MSEPIAYLNGQWLPQSQMALPANDAGFVMGVTVTDFVRTFHHRLDRWPEHLARFLDGLAAASIINCTFCAADVTAIAEEITRRNAALVDPSQELALIVFATPGPIGYYFGHPGGAGESDATLGMHTFPLPFSRYRDMIRDGAWLRVSNCWESLPHHCVPTDIKHRSRMHWWLAQWDVDAMDVGQSKALLTNAAGHVTETAFANVVIVRGNQVISPRRATILPGLSLKLVEELCPEVGLTFHERDLTVDDCFAADEMLLCGTAFCLARVRQLNDTPLGERCEAMNSLLRAWNAKVGLDIHAQILAE